MKRRIIADSSIDTHKLDSLAPDTEFTTVPLTIRFGEDEFVDDDSMNLEVMLDTMKHYQGTTASACPSPGDWIEKFKGVDEIYVVTITGNLSGCHNSAMLAQNILHEENPNVKICIIDSLSTGPEIQLIVEKINELIALGKTFEEISQEIVKYQERTHLLFKLETLDNLVKNGRVNRLVGKVAGLLNIHIVGTASVEGTLEILHKCKGMKRAYESIIKEMKASGYTNGKVIISHCCNLEGADKLKDKIKSTFESTQIEIHKTGGLCSYYAEIGGLLVGYEC